MIGAAAFWRYQAGQRAGWDLDVEPGLRLEESTTPAFERCTQ